MTFDGFPEAALDFYDDLETDNTKSFWEANRHIYLESVRAPMLALIEALSGEFSSPVAKTSVFRPYRDVRFAKDKTPYKTHQGAFVPAAEATGWYVELSPRGVRTGGGFYAAGPDRLRAFRLAIEHDRTGPELAAIVAALVRAGFEVGGDRLKTSPRGFDRDHPRIDLLRHRSLVVGRSHGFEPVIHTPAVLDLVRDDWRALRPLVDWVAEHAEPRIER